MAEEYFIKYFDQSTIDARLKSGNFVERDGRIFDAFGTFEVKLKVSDPSIDNRYKQNSAGAWVNVFDGTPYNGPGFTDGYATSESSLKRESEVIQEDNSSDNKELSLINDKIIDNNDKIADLLKKRSAIDKDIDKYLIQQGSFERQEADDPGSINRRAFQENEINLKNAREELNNIEEEISTIKNDRSQLEKEKLNIEKEISLKEKSKLNTENGYDSATRQGVNSTNSEPKMHKRESIGFSEALAAAKKEANIFSSTGDPCGGKVNAIKLALTSMFNTLRDIKKYGGEYIDGITSQMANIRNLIRDTADVIATALRSVVQRLRNFVISTVRKAIGKIADKIFTSLTQSLKDTIVQKVIDALLCTFTKILTGLGNFVGDFLKELVGKVVNIPLCAAQQFANALINNLAAKIDNAIAPILDGINDIIGGVGKIAGSVFSAIDTILGFESYLCLPPDCPEVNSINFDPSKLGPISSVKDVFDGFKEAKIPTAAGIGKSVTNYIEDFSIFGTKVGDMQEEQEWISCDTNPLKCGMPTIEIFGGGGDGAYATPIVDQLGHVIGADLAEKGAKYLTPPFVAIIDPCDIGQGASAYSEINDDGEVERIVIVNTGNGYNNQPVSDVDAGTTSDYIVCLDAFEIISTGIGYAPTDEITITPNIPNLEVSVQMNEEGQIIQMQVLNSVCGITEMPDIDINSETGAGIQVRPVLSFNKLESPAQIPDNLVDVDISADEDTIGILAQQNIVRVIDCVS